MEGGGDLQDQPSGIQQAYRDRAAPISDISKAELLGKSVE